MKKYISILIGILLCISLIGCSIESENTEISSTSAAISSTVTTETESINTSETTASASTNASSTSPAVTSQTITTTQKAQTAKPDVKTTTTAKSTAIASTTTTSDFNCTVTIECKNVLNKMDKLKAGHETYVPDDGIMLRNYSVTVKNGSTVFDAVKQACSSNGISMNTTSSSYGYYIAGFNNIDEKDCGNASGWIYSVNGTSPNKSCSKYAVKNGDSIVFSYTC